MEYKKVQLKVSNDGINEYKSFLGYKIYSTINKSNNDRTITYKRIYQTPRKNFVYYERSDVNWNYWNDKSHYKSNFDPSEIKSNFIFKVVPTLSSLNNYIDENMIQKLQTKLTAGEVVEELDI
ncbi:EXLDI protein [Xylocopilactobacillus apis]|uniref:EXLDI protein n=1 Tax=Xylocopilactobacillus apis TaxID=2932183 RepID=A0AAU9CZH6_9LACO|nr:EXLDI protein [Xylocopilactobacillus apis]BDR56799.1 hypothetical protein KIMC2_13610 [Xylocopilactobacillus apis]